MTTLRDPGVRGGVLGEKVAGPRRALDVFDLDETAVETVYHSDEVTAICPVTGQPDQYTVTITLTAHERGLESKSLKLYLQSFRNDGVFCEHLAHVIAEAVNEATNAKTDVQVIQKPRGGVSIMHTARVTRKEST